MRYRTVLCIIIVGVSLAGLLVLSKLPPGPQAPPETGRQQVSLISLYHYFSGPLSGGVDDMVAEVNQEEPEIRILAHPLDHEAFKSTIPITLNQGNPPELFTYWAGERTRQLVRNGDLEPIDELWRDPNMEERFSTQMLQSAIEYDGTRYLLPITQHLVVFFFNKRLFAEHQLRPPATWTAFLETCATLKKAGIWPIALGARQRWPAQFWFDYLLLRTAGPEYRERLMRGEASYTDPQVVGSYAAWADLLKQGYFNDDANQLEWDEAAKLICQDRAGMMLMGTWAVQSFADTDCRLEPGEDFDYFLFPMLSQGIPQVAVGPIDGMVVARKSANPDAAKKVLALFGGAKAQSLMSRGSGALAPSREVARTTYTPFMQRLLDEVQAAPGWAFNYDLATPSQVASYGLESFGELIAFPEQYQAIAEKMQGEADAAFRQKH